MSEVNTGQSVDDVDPDVRRFQRQVTADYLRFLPQGPLDISVRRAVAERVRQPWAANGPIMAATDNLRVGSFDVPIRIYRPLQGKTLGALIYLHGGGWALFSINTHDRLMREYAARSGLAVVGVDYSLVPEACFPYALDEITSVVVWLREHGDEHGIARNRLAIGGDSAGANLAISTNLKLRAEGLPVLDAMLLNYGAYDTTTRPSHQRYDGERYMLTAQEMQDFWSAYLVDQTDQSSVLAKPLHADLAGLPPSFLCIPACDILADENLDMGQRLTAAGVATTIRVYPGATHSFLEAVSISSLAAGALDDASNWLAKTMVRP